jgi:flagellar basal body rod protein FlgG
MQLGFTLSGVAGQMAQNKLNNISHNLANVNTVGYMADRASFSSKLSNQLPQQGSPAQTSTSYLTLDKQFINTQAGTIRRTDAKLDFAILGNAYFRVGLPDGAQALTRAGNFRLDANGRLLTQSGLPVLDQRGNPVSLPSGDLSATANGALYVNGEPVADLGLSGIRNPANLKKIGGTLFLTPEGNITPAGKDVSVRQGSLEDSNVNAILAMAEIVDTMRNYQSMMKVVEQYNQMESQLNDRVGMVQ